MHKNGPIRTIEELKRLLWRQLSWQWLITTLAVTLLASATCLGQAPVGNIEGVVSDPSGALISGANVTATSLAEGARRTSSTNGQGYFLISTLQPGEYKVTFESSGFAKVEIAHVLVEVGQTARVDLKMGIAGTNQTLVVEGDVAVVETSHSTVGGVINTRQIEELPLNGRNYLELAKLEPGVEIQEGRQFDPTKTRYTGISVGGRSGREARITLDGVDAVDEHVGTTTLNLSQESIQEFQLSTSTSDPSTGLSATGAVNIITKSGSNVWHAGAFIFGRASAFAARPGLGSTKPDFDREQYGMNLGGPIREDKMFLFGNVERTRENSSISIKTPYFPNLTSFPAPFRETSNNVRIDWHLPRQYQAFFRWSRDDNSNFGGFGGNALPSNGNINANTTDQYAVGLDKVITTSMVNSFRVAYTDFKNHVLPPAADAAALVVPGVAGFRLITDDNALISGPDINTPQQTFERFWQFRDDVTRTAGRHTWRFGGDVVRRRVSVKNFVAGFPALAIKGQPSFNPADLLNSDVNTITIGNKNGKRLPGTPDNAHHNTRLSVYADDSWRMRPNFTLLYGLRYEVDTHPLNNDLNKPDIAGPILPRGTAPTPINKKNFSPSIGFAWDPWSDHKTSIRGGFGLYYAMRISNLVTNERASLAPFNSGNDTVILRPSNPTVDFRRDGSMQTSFKAAFDGHLREALPVVSAGQAVYVAAPPLTIPAMQVTRGGLLISNNLHTPYSEQFNLGVQRELTFKSILDVNFIYSRTVHEFMRDGDGGNFFIGNGPTITLGDGKPASQPITILTSDGFSRYRALMARWDKRFSNRFQFTVSYALSRLETTSTDGLGLGNGTLVNRNVQANYGPGALDRTHRFTFNGIVDLPYGFRISSISTAYSGVANSITVPADLRGDGTLVSGSPAALLPGTRRGSLNREIDSPVRLNALIRMYNLSTAGKPLPRVGTGNAPFLPEIPDNIKFGDSFISSDLQVTKVFSLKERFKLEFSAQMFNIFNISNLVGPAGLPSTPYSGILTSSDRFALGPDGSLRDKTGARVVAGGTFTGRDGRLVNVGGTFGSLSATRPSISTGTGLPRAAQFGARFKF